jgi:hypothetical protein
VQKHDGMELDRLISSKDVDSAPIILFPTIDSAPAQSKDEFEIRRRVFFEIK